MVRPRDCWGSNVLRTILIILVLWWSAPAAIGRDLAGSTVVATMKSASGTIRLAVYVGPTLVFVASGDTPDLGISCGIGKPKVFEDQCTKSTASSCGGLFAFFSGTDYKYARVSQVCTATVMPSGLSLDINQTTDYETATSRLSGFTTKDSMVIKVQGDGCRVSSKGISSDGNRTSSKSVRCEILPGRHL